MSRERLEELGIDMDDPEFRKPKRCRHRAGDPDCDCHGEEDEDEDEEEDEE